MKKIDLEAHFYTEEYVDFLLSRKEYPKMEMVTDKTGEKWVCLKYRPNLWAQNTIRLHDQLLDLGENRLRDMDANGIDIQVLSLISPGCEQFEAAEAVPLVQKINDELARVIRKYPDRFIGLAALAPQDPERAAAELERAVVDLGLGGAKINSNVSGEYLDNRKYWGIFKKAESLGAPLYIHPSIPSPAMLEPYAAYGYALAGPSLGFAAETSLHAMRLILSGVFDHYPGLKVILGHLGEGLPFWFSRMDYFWEIQGHHSESNPKLERKPSDYFKDNFIVTTSGIYFFPAFLCTFLALGADRMAFAVDYPFDRNQQAVQFMNSIPISDRDKEKIFFLNTQELLRENPNRGLRSNSEGCSKED